MYPHLSFHIEPPELPTAIPTPPSRRGNVMRGEGNQNGNRKEAGDYPGGPVVKALPPNAGDLGSIPDQGAEIPYARWL